MMPRVAVLLLTAVVLSATAGAKSAVHVPLQTTEQLTITAKPVLLNPDDPRQKTIGALRYLGGLHLTSAHKNFGGWSGLRMLPDGKRLLAISDEGNWGVFNIEEKADQLVDVKTGLIAPFRDAHGTPLTSKFETDCESVE